MFLHPRRTLFLAASLLWTSAAPSAITQAQQAIRVETKQVLVPVIVFDRDSANRRMNSSVLYDAKEQEAALSASYVHGLTVADFRVLDDGKEQPIQSVTEEEFFYWDVRDNKGYHTEYIGPGGGKWSMTQWPPGVGGDVAGSPHYLIAYNLPASPEGSCHQIKVRVKGHSAAVMARPEYCNVEGSASDPIFPTTLGKEMETFQASENKTMVNLSLTTLSLHRKSGVSRVHVVVEWPWERFDHGNKSRAKFLLGMIFDKQGNRVTRFSDSGDRSYVYFTNVNAKSVIVGSEERYERQLDLSPGDYQVRVVVSDGKNFGRAEIPLIVDNYDGKEFTVSSLSICRQIDDFSAYGHESRLPGTWAAKLPESYIPLLSNGIQFKPASNTRFKNGESLYTYFEVYEPLLASADSQVTVEIQLRVVDARTGATLTAPEAISAAKYIKPGDSVIPIGRGIDISKLPSGSYRLEIRATDSIGKSTAWRTTDFSIE